MKRLFFALWPDDEVRAKLLDKARLLPINTGRHVPPENFHITLVFLGNVEDQAIPELTDGAEGLSIPSFRLQINHAGWWKRAKVAWLAPAYTPEPLLELVRHLNHQARLAGLPIDERDYNPHLTIARKLTRPVKAHVRSNRSTGTSGNSAWSSPLPMKKGARYRVMQSWALV